MRSLTLIDALHDVCHKSSTRRPDCVYQHEQQSYG